MANFINYILFFFVILLTMVSSTKVANKYPSGLTLKLVHRFSLPAYRNEKFEDFLDKNKKKYMRNANFSARRPLFQPTFEHLYFVNLSIGDPPIQQYLSVDTGSSLVWVISNPQRKRYSYQSRYSRTFTYVECGSPECSLSPKFSCTKGGLCKYKTNYADNIQFSTGFLGFDQFMFKTKDRKAATVDNVLLGVATSTSGAFFSYLNFYGMLGLGPGNASFLRNIPRKFSYCVGKVTDHKGSDLDSTVSYLKLGYIDDAYWLTSTYLELDQDIDSYRVDMKCISLGGMCLAINPKLFMSDKTDPYTGVTLDTGSFFTYLPDEAYDIVVDAVSGLMEAKKFDETIDDTQLCYKGQMTEISDFPLVIFHFVEDLDVSLDGKNTGHKRVNKCGINPRSSTTFPT